MVGWPRARRLLLQSERLNAETALDWGLVEAVWEPSEFREHAIELTRRLASGPTRTMGTVRQALWNSMESGFEDQMRWEWDHVVELRKTEDSREARRAFIEKRQPVFKGR
jgi:enoyl-CoA hydratase/carnithine racemase